MFNLIPRNEKFFDQIEQLCGLTRSAAESFGELVGRFPSSNGVSERIAAARDEAAQVLQDSLCRLDEAFITPLDREDILQLSTDLFDVIDKLADVSRRFSLYGLKEMYPALRNQSDALRQVASALAKALTKLRNKKKLRELSPQLEEINALVKQASANRDQFLSELFRDSPDPLEVMKKRDLHDMLESAIADCENVARTMGRVLLKNG